MPFRPWICRFARCTRTATNRSYSSASCYASRRASAEQLQQWVRRRPEADNALDFIQVEYPATAFIFPLIGLAPLPQMVNSHG